MIKNIGIWISSLKIRHQFFLLLLLTGVLCFSLFQFLWQNKWEAAYAARHMGIVSIPEPHDDFFQNLYDHAKEYSVPDSENNLKQQREFAPFFNLCDEYTGMYIYGADDGIYRTGRFPEYFYKHSSFFYNLSANFTDNIGEEYAELSLHFKNGYYSVQVYLYHNAEFIFYYYIFCFIFCVVLFLSALLFFINRKMKSIISMEKDILRMSTGDLEHPINVQGNDEIGILGRELDHLRMTLRENIIQEQESRKANQDLITALSHDLRTPLTILRGYLEVMQLRRNPEIHEEYLRRCLKKTGDIQELTDRMFEYALVSEEKEIPEFSVLTTDTLLQYLRENCEYIRLAGFRTDCHFPEESAELSSDSLMLKRIFTNLFSNILKYGDKESPVRIFCVIRTIPEQVHISVGNTVRKEYSDADSNNIGLKNVQKMVDLLGGRLDMERCQGAFTVHLTFPLKKQESSPFRLMLHR